MTNKADMYARLDRALKQRGYSGPSNGPWLRQLEPGIWARVGAGWLTRGGQALDLHVGVRHDAVERAVAALDPQLSAHSEQPTVSEPP